MEASVTRRTPPDAWVRSTATSSTFSATRASPFATPAIERSASTVTSGRSWARPRSPSGSAITSRISLTPDRTAEKATKRAPVTLAIKDARVVLPEPGGPQRIIECSSPVSIAARSTRPDPRRCSWPTISSSDRGRSRSARGAGVRLATAPCSGSPKRSTLGPPVASTLEPGREERQVGEVGDRRHSPAIEIRLPGAIGDERNARRGRGDPVDPRIADDDRVVRAEPLARGSGRRGEPEMVRNDPPSVRVGLERPHVVARDDQVELAGQAEALERRHRELASVVRPDRRREPGAAGSRDRRERAGLERGDLHRTPLVIERHVPDGGLQRRGLRPAVRDQLAHAVALVTARQGAAGSLDERPHVDRHCGEIEGRLDEGVIEIEHAQSHAETVPQAC